MSTVGAFLSYTNVKEQGEVQLGKRINNVDSIYLTESGGAKSWSFIWFIDRQVRR